MKHRWTIPLVLILIAVNVIIKIPDPELKKVFAEKVNCAIEYYKERAHHYYLQCTGQLPPAIITKHYREWLRFQILCDALLLDSHKSIELFCLYIDAQDKVRDHRIHESQLEPENMLPEPGLQLYHRINREIVSAFKMNAQGMLTHDELSVVDNVLTFRGVAPDIDLRALRLTRLNDVQRKSMRPYSVQLVEFLLSKPSEYPWTLEKGKAEPTPPSPADRDSLESPKHHLMIKANQILSNDQIQEWRSMYAKANQTIEDYRMMFENMYSFFYGGYTPS
ncbi:MAG: hypothetical protein JXR73_23085 [Candidatus Omnitrophica bacterium]|nr:hypothetical protein [Candidatus Omnitrophota bacterium]